jgi:hypothetical protein
LAVLRAESKSLLDLMRDSYTRQAYLIRLIFNHLHILLFKQIVILEIFSIKLLPFFIAFLLIVDYSWVLLKRLKAIEDSTLFIKDHI